MLFSSFVPVFLLNNKNVIKNLLLILLLVLILIIASVCAGSQREVFFRFGDHFFYRMISCAKIGVISKTSKHICLFLNEKVRRCMFM